MASYECRGKNKLWSVRFNIIENNKLIYKRISEDENGNKFTRKKDAELAYHNFILKYQNNKLSQKSNEHITNRKFSDIYNEYITYKKEYIKDSTYYEMIKTFEKHILPYFSEMKIGDITKTTILDFQQTLNNYSYKYKSKIRTFLYSMYKYLFYYYDVDNVIARVEAFKKPKIKKEISIWNINEFETFINTFDNSNDGIIYKTFFTFLYYTGCRLGEVLALNFNDFNLFEKTVSINKNLSTKTSNNTSYSVTSPKTISSYRKILIPEKLLTQLLIYINEFQETKYSKFFFGLEKPLDDHTIYRRLEEHCKISNIKKIRIHDFRHSHASLLITNGANIVLVANRLGHSNTQQTLNTYAHLFPNSEKELINLINNLG